METEETYTNMYMCVWNILYDTKATTNQEANSHKTEKKRKEKKRKKKKGGGV